MMYRYLPTPSDRMGIIWTLLTIKEAIVLEYGPAGTTHFSVGNYEGMGLETNGRIYTTHLGESDIIMGDSSRLEDAIVEIDENYGPKVLFVVSSAAVSVTGADIKGICNYMQQEVKAKLIPVETGGFKGDYSLGLRNGWNMITQQLCQKGKDADPCFYNILGASAYNYRIKSDVKEIQRLMKESFDMQCHVVMGMDASLNDLENMGLASVNLVIQEEALPAAEYMKENFGIPYIYGAPYGYKGTKNWLEEISKLMNKEIHSEIKNELEEKIKGCAEYRMYAMMYAGKQTKPQAAIIGEYDVISGFSQAMSEVFLPVGLKICNHSIAGLNAEDIQHPHSEKEKIDLLKALNKTLVFGDDVSLFVANDTCRKVLVSPPLISRPQIATHMPFMGPNGMDYILEEVENYYNHL